MKEKRKRFIQIFALALIILLIASASYAYFAAQYGEASSTDIIVNTSTVDSLTFETGESISISATQSNFGSGAGNQSGSTYASATLVANNDTNEASAYYSIYLNIPTNEFEYTTTEEYAELILIVTDEDGNLVTSIDGLNYTSVTDGTGNAISGFDITGYTGSIAITGKHEIISYGIETNKWTIEVVFVNLSTDQSGNTGKELSAKLTIMQSGNTLQAVGSSSYSDKVWAYSDSITSIVFDDSGAIIGDYIEVYDISEDQDESILAYMVENYAGYCYYDGNEVSSYSGNTVTESDCSNVYKATDISYSEDYALYYDQAYMDYWFYNDPVTVSWNGEEGVCTTSTGSTEVYGWKNNLATEEQCTGIAYQYWDYDYYYVGIEYVGSGEWSYTTEGNGTYTVYIESNAPILGNEDMSYWFYNFYYLESIEGLDKIIMSNVSTMEGMFYYCGSLTSLDLSSWDTSSVTNMSHMFYSHYNYNTVSLNLSGWDTSNVTDMSWMFNQLMSLTYLNLDGWDTGNVKDMSGMFSRCSNLTSLNLSNWDTSNVISMMGIFQNCSSLTSLDLSSFDTSRVTDMSYMFNGCSNLITLDLSIFDTSNVIDMNYMFNGCSGLTTLDLSSFDTSRVTDMSYMFNGCSGLTALNLSNFDTSNVTSMYYMFKNCTNLTSLNLSNFDTSNVTSMTYMFSDCSSLTTLDLSNFNTSNVTNMYAMFYNCSSLISLDMSIASFTKLTSSSRYNYMFYNNNSSITVTVKDSTAQTFITKRLNEYNGGTVVIS